MAHQLIPQGIFDAIHSFKNLKFNQRLDKISQLLLGTPYPSQASQAQTDLFQSKDHLHEVVHQLSYQHESGFNFKTLDCVTYTETVLGLAYADPTLPNLEAFSKDFQLKLDSIRYQNGIDTFLHRNHFISADWVPNNHAVFHDITSQIGPSCQLATTNINRLSWIHKTQIENKFVKEACPTQEETEAAFIHQQIDLPIDEDAKLDYIPIKDFLSHYQEIVLSFPEETAIVNIVRPAWDLTESIGTKLNVSHQGFVFKQADPNSQDAEQLIFRHATTIDPKQVVELPLDVYLTRYLDSHPAIGLNILSISEEGMSEQLILQAQFRAGIEVPEFEMLQTEALV